MYVYSKLTFDWLEFIIICSAIAVLAYRARKYRLTRSVLEEHQPLTSSSTSSARAAKSSTELTFSIKLQLFLMLMQSLLYSIVDSYQVAQGMREIDRSDFSHVMYTLQLLANAFFMMQHTLFVTQYVRVGATVPLIFSHQSEEVVRKRRLLHRGVLAAELLFAAYLAGSFLYQELSSSLDFVWSELIWNLQSAAITLVLLLALKRLRKHQRRISTIFCDESLMITHCVAFIVSTLLGWLVLALNQMKKEADVPDSPVALRAEVACNVFRIVSLVSWLLVQVLILLVFVKYGKPLEDDERALIESKLMAVFQQEQL